ncbi:MAG: class I SAM-dependent methyltransferase [Opitutaceae bacterium]
MSRRFGLRPRDYLGHHAAKQALNLELFSVVAPKYDFVTKALSLGRDGKWKRQLVAFLPDWPAPLCLDLACGTGDITRLLAARYPGGKVVGLDLTPAMIDIARHLTLDRTVDYLEGSMQNLPFENDSVDIVTGGYALRNAPDLERLLDEMHRVLRPGGKLAFLDFSKAPTQPGRVLGHMALKFWGGFWGWLLHGNPNVYGYIADSLRHYPDRRSLRATFDSHGFTLRGQRRYYLGLLENLVFEKRSDSRP